jgi:CRISPR-associated exonuclease Cas4
MPYPESDLLPISALQHLLYCERQCALIHVERLWAENQFTTEGKILHRRADSGRSEKRPAARTTRGLPVHSLELGLFGIADVVRWPTSPDEPPVPVEYKRGRPKSNGCDRVQLCAQALCLEEMTGRPIPAGALFYGKTRRQVTVAFDAPLRGDTLRAVDRLRRMMDSRITPPAEPSKKCDRCSLKALCLPDLARRSPRRFDHLLAQLLAES